MSWRTLMKADNKPDPTFPGPQENSTKYTKPPGPALGHSNTGDFVDIVGGNGEPEFFNPSATEPAEMVEPSNARLAFDLNGKLPDEGRDPGRQDLLFSSGRTIRFNSPMWGELAAEVLDDRGAVVWCWHPLRECETAIPREWILRINE